MYLLPSATISCPFVSCVRVDICAASINIEHRWCVKASGTAALKALRVVRSIKIVLRWQHLNRLTSVLTFILSETLNLLSNLNSSRTFLPLETLKLFLVNISTVFDLCTFVTHVCDSLAVLFLFLLGSLLAACPTLPGVINFFSCCGT